MKASSIVLSLLMTTTLSPLASSSQEFVQAIKTGATAEAIAFLDQGGNANYSSTDGTSALHWAVYYDNLEVVSRLLRAEADPNIINEYGSSPMLEAAENGNVEMLKALLTAGADVESPNLEGQTALMTAVRTGNAQAVQLLIDQGADVNHQEQWQLQTPLMWAAAQMQPAMVALLLENGADPDTVSRIRVWERRVTAEPRAQRRPPGGWTALSYAARQGCAECIVVLAAGGANLDLVSPEGITPLLMATLNGRWNASAALIEAGADVNRWDEWGRSPLYSAVDFKTVPTGGRADRPSLDEIKPLDVINMLLAAGANPNVQLKLFPPYRDLGADRGADSILSVGTTPLIRAAKGGDVESISALLSYGALVDLPNIQGMTPLIVASGDGSGVVDVRVRYMNEALNTAAAQILLNAGADINAQRDNGRTALHGAAGKGWNDFVKLLADHDADLNREANGLTALDTALGKGAPVGFARRAPQVFPETAALLMDLGAVENGEQ